MAIEYARGTGGIPVLAPEGVKVASVRNTATLDHLVFQVKPMLLSRSILSLLSFVAFVLCSATQLPSLKPL